MVQKAQGCKHRPSVELVHMCCVLRRVLALHNQLVGRHVDSGFLVQKIAFSLRRRWRGVRAFPGR